jgi:hypothetical protein
MRTRQGELFLDNTEVERGCCVYASRMDGWMNVGILEIDALYRYIHQTNRMDE